jgi:serine O-acetyltransferase
VARALEELGREVQSLRNQVTALEAEKTGAAGTPGGDVTPEKPRIVASSE